MLRKFYFTCLIIDEAQDMNKLYFQVIMCAIAHNQYNLNKLKICVIGDKR